MQQGSSKYAKKTLHVGSFWSSQGVYTFWLERTGEEAKCAKKSKIETFTLIETF